MLSKLAKLLKSLLRDKKKYYSGVLIAFVFYLVLWLSFTPILGQVATKSGVATGSAIIATNSAEVEIEKDKDIYLAQDNPEIIVKRNVSIFSKIKRTVEFRLLGLDEDVFSDQVDVHIVYRKKGEEKKFIITPVSQDKIKLTLDENDSPKPGVYTIYATYDGKVHEEEFLWGVLAINTDKTIYTSGDLVKIHMTALDEKGFTNCNANLNLAVTSPSDESKHYSVGNGIYNSDCMIKGYSLVPDYYATYEDSYEPGVYNYVLEYEYKEKKYQVEGVFEVKENPEFDIERFSATRIYPVKNYPVVLKVTPGEDYAGKVQEKVPHDFDLLTISQEKVRDIFGESVNVENVNSEFTQLEDEIIWEVDWKKGETYYLGYEFDSPNESPNYYTIGPLTIGEFAEIRNWQLAIDATVPEFEAGEFTVDDSLDWTTINLQGSYSTAPVVLATPVTHANCGGSCSGNSAGEGGMYPIPLVRNVSTTSFDISMCIDGGSVTCDTGVSSETFHWFAFDVDDATNYSWIEVGTTSSVATDGSNTGETYSTSFSATPDIFTQSQTYSQGSNIGPVAWADDETTSGFNYVGCVHQAPGSGADQDDCETGQPSETFGYVAIDVTNEAFSSDVKFESDFASISASTWTTATFTDTYTTPRVMVTQNDDNGGEDPQYAWARNVSSSGMEFRYCEEDAGTVCHSHTGENVHWFVVEEPALGTVQNHFQWRDDTTDLNTSGGWLTVNEDDNAIGDITKYETYRIRIEAAAVNDESTSRTYELQWGDKHNNDSCEDISTWTGIADSADEFAMAATTHIDPDGESTTSGLLDNSEGYTFVNGEGLDVTDTSGSIGAMSADEYTELEYSIQATDQAVTGNTYCFRLYDTNGSSELDGYEVYPEVTISSVAAADTTIMEWGTQTNVSDDSWTTINFSGVFVNPVFVCSVQYDNNIGNESINNSDTTSDADSVVCRVQSVGTTSAQVRIQEPGASDLQNETVHWLVVEEGEYDTGDVKFEAFTYTSTITDRKNSYNAQVQSYTQSYTDPIVLGQVMTHEDPDWSVFWAAGQTDGSNSAPLPDSSTLYTGKHVAEDTDTTRANETIGVIVFESNHGTLDGVEFETDSGGQTIDRIGEGPNDTYTFASSFSSTPQVGIVAQIGISGGDGPHPELYSSSPFTTTTINPTIFEDEIGDEEQDGNDEAVSYIVFDSSGTYTTTGASLDQTTYRFYQNANSVQPGTALASENTAVTDIANSDVIRLRISLQVGLAAMEASSTAFKLQYGQGSTCSSVGTWNDVGAVDSGTIWRGEDVNTTPSDGDTITSSLLNSQNNILQTYEEENNSANNPNTVSRGEWGEWDWVLQNNGATESTDYCFRMVTSGGTALQYTRYPALTTAAAGIDISGTAYTDDDEVTTLDGVDVCVAVNSTHSGGDCDTTSSGVFSVTGVDATSGGEQITLFVDGATNGNVVTVGDGNDITGLVLYQNHVLLRYEQGSSIAIVDMDAYDNDQNSTDLLFDAEDSSPDTLNWEAGTELFVQSGFTFAPGGNVNGHDIEIDGTWTASSGESINVDGSFKLDSGGTFTPSTSTLTFDAGSGTEDFITAGTGNIYDLVINDSGGSLTVEVEDPLVVDHDVTITGGTLDVVSGENNSINVGRSWSNSDTFEPRSGIVTFDGSTAATINSGCADTSNCPNQDFYNLTVNKDSSGDTVGLSTTNLLVSNTLTVTTGTVNQGSQNIRAEGATALSIGGSGTWSNQSTGDLAIGGSVVNSGTMSLVANGVCGGVDDIVITSVSGTPSWSGAGTYELEDVDITNQNASVSIDTFSSTDSGGNTGSWNFYPGCTTGSLTTDIVDSGGSPVTNPSISMGNTAFSFTYQTTNGTFGVSSEKLRVSNTTANSQWTLSLAADLGPTSTWNATGGDYDYNDPTAGAGDGTDTDSYGGQMSVDPSVGSLAPEGGCTTTGLSLGSSSAYNEETSLNSITLLTAGSSAEVGCYWDLTSVDIDQSIPEEQFSDNYSIDMTLSVVAN